MMQTLVGKRALVTGANDGIGRAIAETFAREGATVAAHGRSEERLADVLATIDAAGGRAFPVSADLRDVGATERMCADAIDELGGIDIVVNNAGMLKPGFTLDTDVETWDEHFDVNVKACFVVCVRTLPAMIEQGTGGRVINNASIGAKLGDAGLAAYDSSKHALLGFSRCLAAEMGEHRITVNCLCPGHVDTKMGQAVIPALAELWGRTEQQLFEELMNSFPIRAVIEPRNVADLALFLASDQAAYITGQSINIDCGYCMS